MAAEVIQGLGQDQKAIPPKYFYDAAGSRLFDAITRLPEYYLTRTEVDILRANQAAIAAWARPGACVVEYGSGSSVKVRILLDACQPAAYVPVDISKDHLAKSAREVFQDYPVLAVYPTCADYTAPFALPPLVAGLPRVAFFPGSSIGNFDPEAADAFLRNTASALNSGDCFIVGVDTKKDRSVLLPAYNDDAGVTASFNRNLLLHLNAALGGQLRSARFRASRRVQRRRGPHRDVLGRPPRAGGNRRRRDDSVRPRRIVAHREFVQIRARRIRGQGGRGGVRAPRALARRAALFHGVAVARRVTARSTVERVASDANQRYPAVGDLGYSRGRHEDQPPPSRVVTHAERWRADPVGANRH